MGYGCCLSFRTNVGKLIFKVAVEEGKTFGDGVRVRKLGFAKYMK